MTADQLTLEQLFPQFLLEKWNVDVLAEKAGVHHTTASRFLETKREELRVNSSGKIIGIAAKTWKALERRALIDRKTLEGLNDAQEAGEEVSDKLVSSVVKRLIALINMSKSMRPSGGDDVPDERLIGGSLNRK